MDKPAETAAHLCSCPGTGKKVFFRLNRLYIQKIVPVRVCIDIKFCPCYIFKDKTERNNTAGGFYEKQSGSRLHGMRVKKLFNAKKERPKAAGTEKILQDVRRTYASSGNKVSSEQEAIGCF